MLRKLVIGALSAMAVLFSITAFAQGTAGSGQGHAGEGCCGPESRQGENVGYDQQGGRWLLWIAISMCFASI